MRNEDLPQFAQLLADVLAGYGKPLPEKGEINMWFRLLSPYPPATVRKAFETYCMDRPDFAPNPNGIGARCKLLDGRPDDNEAWAIAIRSKDERETVVWTDEMAEAFRRAGPLIESGDEVGARMAFKDAYKRLVEDARASNRPANWSVSSGWDAQLRQIAVQSAVVAGLLTGPKVHLALGNESSAPLAKPEGLKRLMEAMAQLEDANAKVNRLHAEHLAELEAIENRQREDADRKTREYLKQHPEARYGQLLKERAK